MNAVPTKAQPVPITLTLGLRRYRGQQYRGAAVPGGTRERRCRSHLLEDTLTAVPVGASRRSAPAAPRGEAADSGRLPALLAAGSGRGNVRPDM